MSKKIIFLLVIIALIMLVGFLASWYYKNQTFSKNVLTLQISGPSSANMGDQITYIVTYKNNGNFVLENPQLTFNFPDDSLVENGNNVIQQNLKNIYPGEQETLQFQTRLLGKEGDVKTAHAAVSYMIQNLSSQYETDADFSTTIGSVPMTLNFNLPPTVKQGQKITYMVNYFSNIDYPLENMSVKVSPLNGFTVESAEPSSLDNIEWKLNTLNKGQGGSITITGIVNADTPTTLRFSMNLGQWQDGSFIIVKNVTQDVSVITAPTPAVNSSTSINNNTTTLGVTP